MADVNQREDRTWYVCIQRMGGANICYSFMGAGGEAYRGFAELAKQHGVEIVAEQFGVSDAVVNRITGFDETGKRTERHPLKELVDEVDAGRVLDVGKALAELCRAS